MLTLFRMGLFGATHGWGAKKSPPPPSLKSVTHILQWWNLAQLYLTLKRFRKYMNHITHQLSSAEISIFSPKISKICCIKKYRYRLHFDSLFLILLTFFWSLKIVLINMAKILMSANIATLGLPKIKVLWRVVLVPV